MQISSLENLVAIGISFCVILILAIIIASFVVNLLRRGKQEWQIPESSFIAFGSDYGRKKSWLERLVFERTRSGAVTCPVCAKSEEDKDPNKSSIDVVCNEDGTSLFGLNWDERSWKWVAWAFRGSAVVVAFTVGYLTWPWPTYIFGGLLAIVFFGLFLRNHLLTLGYFLVIALVCLGGLAIWNLLGPPGWDHTVTTVLIIVALLAFAPLFVAFYSLRTPQVSTGGGDNRRMWLNEHKVDIRLSTLTWIACMMILCILFLATFATTWLVPQLTISYVVRSLSLRLSVAALGSALIAALVSCTIFSLRGQPFRISPILKSPPKIGKIQLDPLEVPNLSAEPNWYEQFSIFVTRSTNSILKAVENNYNNVLVPLTNNLVLRIVQLVNYVHRTFVMVARHLFRTMGRFAVLIMWATGWVLEAGSQYSWVFVLPPVLWWLSATVLYNISANFSHYVHQGPAYLPLVMALEALAVIVLLSIIVDRLLRIGYFKFLGKVGFALSKHGFDAFLFFLATAWLLGFVGALTNGPYRIGWVTITSTVILIVGALVIRLRGQPKKEAK